MASSLKKAHIDMSSRIIELSRNTQELIILDAGCGNKWPFDLEIECKLIGIDLDSAALDIRSDLDVKICDDLRFANFEDESFDVIYNSFVLEHVEGAQNVLNNFAKWLKPNGLLLLNMPDKYTTTAFVTRMTPHFIKVWYKRYRGNRNAGKPGYAPYPTVYDEAVSRQGIYRFCKENNLAILEEYLHRIHLNNTLIRCIARIISYVFFSKLSYEHDALSYIIKKC